MQGPSRLPPSSPDYSTGRVIPWKSLPPTPSQVKAEQLGAQATQRNGLTGATRRQSTTLKNKVDVAKGATQEKVSNYRKAAALVAGALGGLAGFVAGVVCASIATIFVLPDKLPLIVSLKKSGQEEIAKYELDIVYTLTLGAMIEGPRDSARAAYHFVMGK